MALSVPDEGYSRNTCIKLDIYVYTTSQSSIFMFRNVLTENCFRKLKNDNYKTVIATVLPMIQRYIFIKMLKMSHTIFPTNVVLKSCPGCNVLLYYLEEWNTHGMLSGNKVYLCSQTLSLTLLFWVGCDTTDIWYLSGLQFVIISNFRLNIRLV